MPLYLDFADQEALDAQYDCDRWVSWPEGLKALRAERAAVNGPVLSAPWRQADVHYGPTLAERLDIYPAETPGAPILLYIHGGGWSAAEVTKDTLGWISIGPRQAGLTTLVIDYAQAPWVSIGEIVRQCRAALAWAYRNAESFGGDKDRIYVTGNSAGGHLTSMVGVTDWAREYGLPTNAVKGFCALSGVYDLTPIKYSFVQAKTQLDEAEIERSSPIRRITHGQPPALIMWGNDESDEFKRQSIEFAGAYEAAGNRVATHAVVERDHYSILNTWREADSDAFRLILDHMKSCWSDPDQAELRRVS